MTRYLYALAVPDEAIEQPQTSRALQLASNSPLTTDVPEVSSLSADPGSRTLAGVVAGQFADIGAREFEELFSSTGIEVVPWYGDGDGARSIREGYYALEDVQLQQATSRESRLQRFDGQLRQAGTRASFYRAVYANPQPVDNPFGGDPTAEIGVSARAEDVEWWDQITGDRESATVRRTVVGEHDRINIYDATEPSMDAPVLIHSLALDAEWPTDVRVWDDYNRPKESRSRYSGPTVGSATVGEDGIGSETVVPSTWQRCFVTGHEFVGRPVLETDRLRLRADRDRGRLVASRWSSDEGQYTLVQLGQSDWRLADLDLARIGVERIEAQTTWRDVSNGDRHRLDLTLKRGRDNALWTVPDNGSSPPSGLTDRLSPIASTAGQDAAEVADIVEKSQVRE
jgi:hypothetical protein